MMKNCVLFFIGLMLMMSIGLYSSAEVPPTIVEIRDYSYQPGSITVPAGTTVA